MWGNLAEVGRNILFLTQFILGDIKLEHFGRKNVFLQQ